jgi:ABC-type spermidine/putrescine transport system permease subunit II
MARALWRRTLGGWVGITVLFLYLPIAVVIAYSFNANPTNVSVWTGFTTEWFGRVFTNQQAIDAIFTSLRIASVNAVLAMTLGTLAAVGLRFAPRWLRVAFDTLAYLTLVTPIVVLGISTLIAFVIAGIPRGALTILLVHVVFNSSIVFLIVRARLVGLSFSEEQAALDLGANRWSAFTQITLPRLAPAVLAGGLLAFTYSWDDYVIASFINGPATQTLPLYVFSQLRFGVSPQVNVLATITLAVTVAALALVVLILRRALPKGDLSRITPIAMERGES